MAKQQRLMTVGYTSEEFKRDPREIRIGLKHASALPVLILDELEYFDAGDVVKAIKWLQQMDREAGRG